MASYLLVGGAWIGGWAWRQVADGLRRRGHDVFPATLTGLGDRVHLASPEVDLETHIADVVNMIEAEDLADVILVGHSYAGIVVAGVADRAGDQLRQLVYLDTAPMEDGESILDFSPPEAQEAIRRTVEEHGDGWRLPFPSFEELGQQASLVGLDEADRRFMASHAVDQPFRTYTQPLRLSSDAAVEPRYDRVLIACDDARAMIDTGMPRLQGFVPPAWRRHDLATGHWAMLSAPDELVDVLDRLTIEP